MHWSKRPSPFVLSRASCRPRFLPGFRTQWLLVAVTSNTNHPSSTAQITRESSRNRSDSLEEEKEGITCAITKDRSKPALTQVTETRNGVMEWREGVGGVWRSGTKKKERWSEEGNEGGKLGGMEGSRWWGPGEHFIFLIDNNGFINGRSFHTPHTVHHWLEFCGRAKKPMRDKKKKKKKAAAKDQKLWKV